MLSRRAVAGVLPVLTAVAGSLDVFCVTQLGGAFASIITGNLVQFGRAIVIEDGTLAAGVATAVGGYALGVAAGALGLRGLPPGWHPRTSLLAAAEAVLLSAVAAGWQAASARPSAATALVLLMAAAVAMGMQSAISLGTGVPGAATTYLTGTLTNLVRTVTVDPHRFISTRGSVVRLAALLCGASAGAVLLRAAPAWAPVLPAALATAVVAVALVGHRRAAS